MTIKHYCNLYNWCHGGTWCCIVLYCIVMCCVVLCATSRPRPIPPIAIVSWWRSWIQVHAIGTRKLQSPFFPSPLRHKEQERPFWEQTCRISSIRQEPIATSRLLRLLAIGWRLSPRSCSIPSSLSVNRWKLSWKIFELWWVIILRRFGSCWKNFVQPIPSW